LHTELKPFLNSHFPEIKLAIDIEKRSAIDYLKESGGFQMTHEAIARLEPFVDVLTDDEVNELLVAGVDNSQIRWIGSDPDVRTLYLRLIEPRVDTLNPELLERLDSVFSLSTAPEVPYDE